MGIGIDYADPPFFKADGMIDAFIFPELMITYKDLDVGGNVFITVMPEAPVPHFQAPPDCLENTAVGRRQWWIHLQFRRQFDDKRIDQFYIMQAGLIVKKNSNIGKVVFV